MASISHSLKTNSSKLPVETIEIHHFSISELTKCDDEAKAKITDLHNLPLKVQDLTKEAAETLAQEALTTITDWLKADPYGLKRGNCKVEHFENGMIFKDDLVIDRKITNHTTKDEVLQFVGIVSNLITEWLSNPKTHPSIQLAAKSALPEIINMLGRTERRNLMNTISKNPTTAEIYREAALSLIQPIHPPTN